MSGLPASYWAYIAFSVLLGLLVKRWPLVALYGACAAFCEVTRAIVAKHFLFIPDVALFADTILFVLPTVPLTRACGASNWRVALRLLAVPSALLVHHYGGTEARSLFLPLGVAFSQGTAALTGFQREIEERGRDRKLSRWAATCIAIVGLIGIGFSPIWADVAWSGVAAHAFACLAYLVHDHEK